MNKEGEEFRDGLGNSVTGIRLDDIRQMTDPEKLIAVIEGHPNESLVVGCAMKNPNMPHDQIVAYAQEQDGSLFVIAREAREVLRLEELGYQMGKEGSEEIPDGGNTSPDFGDK